MTSFDFFYVYTEFVCPECGSTGKNLGFEGFFIVPREEMFINPHIPSGKEETPPFVDEYRESVRKAEELYKSKEPHPLVAAVDEWVVCNFCARSSKRKLNEALDAIVPMAMSGIPIPWVCHNPVHDEEEDEVFGGAPMDDDVRRQIHTTRCCIRVVCDKCKKKFLVHKKSMGGK